MEVAQPKDLEEDFGQAKKRHAELCRQKRIFNARNRIFGVSPFSPEWKGRTGAAEGRERRAAGGKNRQILGVKLLIQEQLQMAPGLAWKNSSMY